ncbi:FAD-binding protein [Kitasatospora sp. NPDC056531]|uniref:FAD-binding protein n=1 Tax=Kitasatospora sp. NPDC056531 TaxID=3345856 RepID=UPI003689BB42
MAIDTRGLDTIPSIRPGQAVVEAGVTRAQLTDTGLIQGRVPPCLTNYPHPPVDGTLSAGDIGRAVQRYGMQVDTVQELQVVTGTGEPVTASREHERELIEAVPAG